jgi:hypothetical protein
MIEVGLCDSWASNHSAAGNEDSHPGTSVVHYSKDWIIPPVGWEAGDEVHGYYLEWFCVRVGADLV